MQRAAIKHALDVSETGISLSARAHRESPLLIHAHTAVTVATPFAPVFPDQVDVWLNTDVPSYTELSDQLTYAVATALCKTVAALATARGVADFNIVAHQAPLSGSARFPRCHWHVFPRSRRREGFLEMGQNVWVVDVFPETTAAALRPFFG